MSYIPASLSTRHGRVEYAQGLISRTGDVLLAAAGDLKGRDVLVLGSVTSSTMCALAMGECRRAESRLPGCRVESGSADVVLIPDTGADALPGLVRQTTIALSAGGSLVTRMPHSERAATALRNLLMGAAFSDLREVFVGGEWILLAEATAFNAAR